MRNFWSLMFLVIFFWSCSTKNDKQEIQACFNLYKNSCLENDGKTAANNLDMNTIDYFGKVLEHIKSSNKSTVLGQNFANMYIILQTRNKVNNDIINNFNPTSFVAYAIDNGMVGKESIQKLEFVEVSEIKNNKAKATIKISGTNKAYSFVFNKEAGVWKMSLTPIIKMSMRKLNMQYFGLERTGLSLEDFLTQIVKAGNSNQLIENIWQPTMEK